MATKAIICFEGKYLIIKRSDDDETGAGTWEFPSGKLEFSESVEECVVREETELDVEISGLGYVTDFFTSEVRKLVLINYLCSVKTARLRCPMNTAIINGLTGTSLRVKSHPILRKA